MTEKTEWEVIDTPLPEDRQTSQHRMKALLGSWWQWKVLGGVVVAGLALVFFVALTSVIVVAISVGALLLFGIGKIRQWLRRGDGAASS